MPVYGRPARTHLGVVMRMLGALVLWAVATLVSALALFAVVGLAGRPQVVHVLVILVVSALGAAWLVRAWPLGRRRARED